MFVLSTKFNLLLKKVSGQFSKLVGKTLSVKKMLLMQFPFMGIV